MDSSYNSPRWTGEILDCAMPMTFDTYSRCAYRCLYCFAINQKGNKQTDDRKALNKRPLQSVNVDRVKAIFNLERGDQFHAYIKNRKVMQWGGLTDQFDEHERRHGKTLELLRYFKAINYPLRFSTKATWWLDDPRYTDLIRNQKNWVFMISVINWDPVLAAKIEKGVDSPQKRIEALGRIADLNCAGAILRLRPFVIGMTDRNDDHLTLIREAAKVGVQGMSTEFFCLETRANEDVRKRYASMSKSIGIDLVKMYKRLSTGGGYMRLNRNVKGPYVKAMKDLCDEVGIRFNTSDADWKEQGCSGGCCSLPSSMNYSKGQFTEAIIIAKKKGEVTWDDISGDMDDLHFPWVKAEGFNTGTVVIAAKRRNQSMFEYIREIWNTPNSARSPYKFFGGVLVPHRLDANGNVVYRYDYVKATLPGAKTQKPEVEVTA